MNSFKYDGWEPYLLQPWKFYLQSLALPVIIIADNSGRFGCFRLDMENPMFLQPLAYPSAAISSPPSLEINKATTEAIPASAKEQLSNEYRFVLPASDSLFFGSTIFQWQQKLSMVHLFSHGQCALALQLRNLDLTPKSSSGKNVVLNIQLGATSLCITKKFKVLSGELFSFCFLIYLRMYVLMRKNYVRKIQKKNNTRERERYLWGNIC